MEIYIEFASDKAFHLFIYFIIYLFIYSLSMSTSTLLHKTEDRDLVGIEKKNLHLLLSCSEMPLNLPQWTAEMLICNILCIKTLQVGTCLYNTQAYRLDH